MHIGLHFNGWFIKRPEKMGYYEKERYSSFNYLAFKLNLIWEEEWQ